MRMTIWVLVFAMSMMAVAPERALGQVARASIGTAVGIAGGAAITLSVVVARARFEGVYLDSADDLLHWQSAPMILTPAVGLAFGLAGKEALRGSVIGSTTGLLAGTVLGAGVGWLTSNDPEAPWAGGVIGSGVGMTVGGLGLGIRGWLRSRSDADADPTSEIVPDDATRIEFRFPL